MPVKNVPRRGGGQREREKESLCSLVAKMRGEREKERERETERKREREEEKDWVYLSFFSIFSFLPISLFFCRLGKRGAEGSDFRGREGRKEGVDAR